MIGRKDAPGIPRGRLIALHSVVDPAAVRRSPPRDPLAEDSEIVPVVGLEDLLRERLTQLNEIRYRRMNAHELAEAISTLEQSLSEQSEAAQKLLNQAARQLRTVMTKYPGTDAAAEAQQAIEKLRSTYDSLRRESDSGT